MEMLTVHQGKDKALLYLMCGIQELALCVFRGSKISMCLSAISRNTSSGCWCNSEFRTDPGKLLCQCA